MAIDARIQSAQMDAVRAEQVRLLFSGAAPSVISTFLIALVLAAFLMWSKTLSPAVAAVWLSALAVQTVSGLLIGRAYHRAQPPAADWRPWARRFVGISAASGLIWGAVMPWLMAPGRFDLQMLVGGMMIAGTYSMIGSTGAYLPAFATFILPFPTLIGWCLLRGDAIHVTLGVITALWLPSVAVLARQYNATLVEALKLRFENAALADGLRAQKHAAEQSSAAKSRFLAAASHDLRQPVQALAIFVGALKGHRLPSRSATLVDHIDSSLQAMEGLFTSILDMSRLDAGLVQSRPQRVPLEPMLARICRELAPEAAGKGLSLRRGRTSLLVVSDPALLERILRNLIGNAVRYTTRGGVMVGARRWRDQVRLEVWDTGPGIAESDREAVFEEFYQLANPHRDRGEGLGLGLAIVRRLAVVMDHPLSMDSRPGKGTVFRLTAPRVEERRRAPRDRDDKRQSRASLRAAS